MERTWTDGSGRRWTVRSVPGSGGEGREPEPGRGEGDAALEFRAGDTVRSVPTERAGALGEMSDQDLEGLLKNAGPQSDEPDADLRDAEGSGPEGSEGGTREGRPGRRGPGQASPTAAGRESVPHADPARRGRTSSRVRDGGRDGFPGVPGSDAAGAPSAAGRVSGSGRLRVPRRLRLPPVLAEAAPAGAGGGRRECGGIPRPEALLELPPHERGVG